MRVSLRTQLLQAIRDFRDLHDRLAPGYDGAAPADAIILMEELKAREAALQVIWEQALPEMNPLERKRYVGMIGQKMSGVPEGPVKEYSQEAKDALARIQKVFPNAKFYDPEAKKEEDRNAVPRSPRPEGPAEVVRGTPRNAPEQGAVLPKTEPKPAQPDLL
jgi:hypothetical protein